VIYFYVSLEVTTAAGTPTEIFLINNSIRVILLEIFLINNNCRVIHSEIFLINNNSRVIHSEIFLINNRSSRVIYLEIFLIEFYIKIFDSNKNINDMIL